MCKNIIFNFFKFLRIIGIFNLVVSYNIKDNKGEYANLLRKKGNKVVAYNLTSYTQYESFKKQNKNIYLYFYSDKYCEECREIKTSIEEISKIEFVQRYSTILFINCDSYINKNNNDNQTVSLCQKFEIKTIPFMLINYYHPINKKYKQIKFYFDTFDTKSITSLIYKITIQVSLAKENKYPIMELKKLKDINQFSNDYGDVSFLLILKKDEENEKNPLLNCYSNNIALSEKYITQFFFAYAYSESIQKKIDSLNVSPPSIFMTGINYNDFNLYSEVNNCDDIEKFIEKNKLPIFMNYNKNYLFKLMKMEKTIFIFLIKDKKESLSEIPTIINEIQKTLIERRDLVFGYLEKEKDEDLLSFFKLSNKEGEWNNYNIIIYDFKLGKYHLDYYNGKNEFDDLLKKFDNNKLIWTSGYFIEDFLSKHGFNVDRKILTIIFFCIFSFLIIISCIFCFNSMEKIGKKEKEKIN